jgi:hypothetical protein
MNACRKLVLTICVSTFFSTIVNAQGSASNENANDEAHTLANSKAACKASTLTGYYIYAQDGFSVSGSEATQRIPFAQVGREYYDGAGAVSGVYTSSVNGKIQRGRYFGTYQVGGDCSGTVTFTDNLGQTYHYDIYLADGGEEFTFIQTDSGIVSAAFERRRGSSKN